MNKITARKHVDAIWGTEDMTDLSDFTIPLSSAVNMMEAYSKVKNLSLSGVSGSAFVIMNKGKVYENILFTSQEEARNFIKMRYPKRNFKETVENVLVCAYYGTKFIIEEQHYR